MVGAQSGATSRSHAFWLPTPTDKFYPDFSTLLKDGRTLVVEYKGGQLLGGSDAREKEAIGKLWEQRAAGASACSGWFQRMTMRRNCVLWLDKLQRNVPRLLVEAKTEVERMIDGEMKADIARSHRPAGCG